MANYDKSIHSKNKLGLVGNVPVSPFPAIAAQLNPASGALHLRVMGESYVTGTLRGAIPPSRLHATLAAIKSMPSEPSYSGSATQYRQLTVVGDGGSGIQTLMAGALEVCKLVVDPTWEIVSGDEPLSQQIDSPDSGGDDSDTDDDGDA